MWYDMRDKSDSECRLCCGECDDIFLSTKINARDLSMHLTW